MVIEQDRLPLERVLSSWQKALQKGYGQHSAVLFHDLSWMRARLDAIREAFPEGALHALAIKANPTLEVLRAAVAQGAGLEAASWEEVCLARAAGCAPERILFDSPAKTEAELEMALQAGIRLNADNALELERIDRYLRGRDASSRLGLRVNPQVGGGSIDITSVATRGSRFGVPLENGEAVVEAFTRYPWLTGLHYHVGSQGCGLELFLEAARRMEKLRQDVERALGPARVTTMDLGGGLSASYRDSDPTYHPAEYARALKEIAPAWFTPGLEMVTEFGRWVQASCGWAVSRVEYVKSTSDGLVVTLHLGADLMLRRAYQPELWHHDFLVLDPWGNPRQSEPTACILTGPLCFAGDVLARDLPLPRPEPGDFVAIRDLGAYTLSLWSRHCSRAVPEILGVDGEELVVLRRRERAEDVVRLWSKEPD